jgi:phosphate starvation-inducible PhoH-like protein
VTRVLDHVDDIEFIRLTSEDVVRHNLVGRIVDAYTKYDAEKQARAFEKAQESGQNRDQRRGHPPQDHRGPGPDRPRRRR